jgi:hypothetical protein
VDQDKEFEKWKQGETFNKVDKEPLREELLKELEFLSKMSVEEYTLFRKWQEIQYKYPVEKTKSISFFGSSKGNNPEIQEIKKNIWMPSKPEDYLRLQPVVIQTESQKSKTTWTILRTFIHTMLNNPNIGRNLTFTVIDKITNKYLGIICLSSDFMDLTPRDQYIGWSRDIKTKQKMINHTSIASTIVPTQPLGYSFVGGKLLALLSISEVTENAWNERYKDRLAGITTTSLYGSFSQYQNLTYWTKRGHSSGSIRFEPSKELQSKLKELLKSEEPKKYWEWYHAKRETGLPLKRDHKQRSLSYIYKLLDIPKELVETNHQRGIYFCPLFTNASEYLRKEIEEDKLVKRFDNSVESLTQIWKEKYARKRVEGLLVKNKYSTDTLFYDDLIGLPWEECKKRYLKEVGR